VNTTTLFLPCANGVEPLLAAEVQRITGQQADESRGGVWVEGDERMAMRLNLECRLAQRVLWPLLDGPYHDEHDLYDMARRVPWPQWITPEHTLRVDVSAQRSPLQSLNFAALRIKDAVCDTLREATGARPSVDTRNPDLAIALFVGPEHANLYVDTSGQALFKRGWRVDTGEAPLKETLAAAMLAAAGWQGRAEDGPLLDPCCGAGTIAIEAAQMACGIAPGSQRRFAFERLLPFKPFLADWRQMQAAAQARVHAPAVAIYASDVSFRLADFAKRNAQRAGVAHAIQITTVDALQRLPPAPTLAAAPTGTGSSTSSSTGTLVMNPPYGERIAPRGTGVSTAPVESREGFEGGGTSAEFFGGLASHWKRHYAGWTAWLLSPDMKLPSHMRLKESRRVPMWNGPIECRLFRFDMTAGAGPGGKDKRPKAQEPAQEPAQGSAQDR
jgi:putative N6-adenine-specific DNA methylase